ncbi:MAG: hypothetical protein HY696_11745 [Deltaproteobacteria bacterium]|nr:hypothetical protein [Deltaproteobacteria bacterium]
MAINPTSGVPPLSGTWWHSRAPLTASVRRRLTGAAFLTAAGLRLQRLAPSPTATRQRGPLARAARELFTDFGAWCHQRGRRTIEHILGQDAGLLGVSEVLLENTSFEPVRPTLGIDVVRASAEALLPAFHAHCGPARLAAPDPESALAQWAESDGGIVWRIAEDPPHYFAQQFHVLRMVDCGMIPLDHAAARRALLRLAHLLDLATWHPMAATIIAFELQRHADPAPDAYLHWAGVLDTLVGQHGGYAERVRVLFGTIGITL